VLTFILVVLALFLIPGPAVTLTVARSVAGGRRVGIWTGVGIAVGDLLHTVALTLGISALIMTSALVFELIKYLGAAYLVYLGVKMLWMRKVSGGHVLPETRRISSSQAFRQAVIIELLNPKTALFFLAFLPQFVQLDKGPVAVQLLTLGLVFVLMSILYTSLLAVLAGSLGKWLTSRPRFMGWQDKAVGAIYIGLGLQLVFQEKS